jgi:coniferyl-aldehyde dehydrogenase
MSTGPELGTTTTDFSDEGMRDVLRRQRASHLEEGPPTEQVRIERLDRAIGSVVDHADEIVDALMSDFGNRSREESLLTNVAGSIEPLKFAKKNLRRWMRAERRKPMFPLNWMGAKAEVRYQPLGVVGVISPWNFPFNLTFGPLAGILAAGNRVMIKPSEFTPASSALMERMFSAAFDEKEVAVFTGGPDVGQAFGALPFDHLLFTGATNIGRHVMRAAAENLVPVTLELGGKSPVFVGRSADLKATARKIMAGKMMNAGQICLAPDYVFVAKEQREPLLGALRDAVSEMFGSLADNPDYTSIINQRHRDRLEGYLSEARAQGATVMELNPAEEDLGAGKHGKMAPSLVIEPDDKMAVMQEEIFGPVLPIKTYEQIDEAIDYVNRRDRPLAIYYFGTDSAEKERILARTTSGGVTVNDVIMHVSVEDLPFGGIGASGMGNYHGHEGFKTFSHARAVFEQSKIDVGAMMRPPYGAKIRSMVKRQVKR